MPSRALRRLLAVVAALPGLVACGDRSSDDDSAARRDTARGELDTAGPAAGSPSRDGATRGDTAPGSVDDPTRGGRSAGRREDPVERPPATRPPARNRDSAGAGDGAPSRSGGDTARGVVRVTGSHPFPTIVLQPTEGGPLTLTGEHEAALRRLAGVDVVVRGTREGRSMRVSAFTVRAADGEPAIDGVVERAGDGIVIRTASGRVRLGNPPAALRDMVGARVWVTGSHETGPNVFGVITPAR